MNKVITQSSSFSDHKKVQVIALDLEGTLISNAISQIPRPHLYEFLDGCKSITERVVMFTTVKEDKFRQIAQLLVSEGVTPAWFESMEYIDWNSHKKDLSFIPSCNIESAVLVDDVEAYVESGQEGQWLEIAQFSNPYPDSDVELLSMLRRLEELS
ncbi:NIF family HAD-type phosphatase [Photobacterium swingsii]|uniref:NIF family HAD-type phosphatase n=1 Tax=Photobacterium swingsii TaxID=680026 RepID=UPI00352EA0B2